MQTLYFCPVVSSFLFPSLILSCEFRMQVWHVLHVARWKEDAKICYLGTISHSRAVSSQLRHVSTIEKKFNFLNSNISRTCPHNMVNFGPLVAEIGLVVWGTPANFNGFHVSAALLHGTLVSSSGRQPNFAVLNRGCHIHSAGQPSSWALAYILVSTVMRDKFIGTRLYTNTR